MEQNYQVLASNYVDEYEIEPNDLKMEDFVARFDAIGHRLKYPWCF
jgi:hypothetical protein